MIKKLTFLASLLLVIGIVGAALTIKPVLNAESTTKEQILKEDFTAVNIDAENITVNIKSTNDSQATIEMVTRSSEYNLMTDVNDNTLAIKVKHEYKKIFSFDFFNFTPKLNIYLPEQDYNKVNITTTNGIISVENITSEEVGAISTNGIIKLKDVIANKAKTETENGMIDLENVEGDITSVTTNGKVDLRTPDLDRMIDVKTTNGRIKLVTDKKPTNATIAVSISNGKATVFGSSNPHSVYGDGENQVKLTTENGLITVE